MYERFFNLRERPFSLTPDPDYLYPSRVHKEALGYLRYGIEGHAGFVVITGEIGSGKTTLLQAVLRGLDRQTSVSRIVNSTLEARELLEAVMLDFGMDPGHGRSKPHLVHELARYLVDQRMAGRFALLVIDEAQNLSPSALEEVRMLSNLETEKSKLIQIVLVGQPNLRDILARPELEQLRQRVTVSYHLQTLDAEDTSAYVNHRLKRGAIGAPLEFSRDVTDLIHLHSRGIPRKINVIADAILLFGYSEEKRVVNVELAAAALEELEATGIIDGQKDQAAQPAARSAAVVPAAGPSGFSDRQLEAREARVVEREKWIAEQQRVLQESYRLLRSYRPPAPPAGHPVAASVGLARPALNSAQTITAPQAQRPVAAPLAAARPFSVSRPPTPSRGFYVHTVPPESIWTRLRRQFLHAVRPVFEE